MTRFTSLIRWIFGFLVVIGMIFIVSATLVRNQVADSYDYWALYQDSASPKERALNELVSNLGYGGMIHEFKNYVLRKDSTHMGRIQFAAGAAYSALDSYETSGVSKTEKAAIDVLKKMIATYAAKSNLIGRLRAEGKNSRVIDQKIVVDDQPALEGIKVLKNAVVSQRHLGVGEATKVELLVDLREALGYGGMIHHFKNYVLRKDPRQLPKIRANIILARNIVKKIKLLGINSQESSALKSISDTITIYEGKTTLLESLPIQRMSIEELDSQVRVDDSAAVEGFRSLITIIAEQTNIEHQQLADNLVSAKSITAVIILVAALSSLLLMALIHWLIVVRIVKPTINLTKLMHMLAKGNLNTAISGTNRKDEIGEMAEAVEIFKQNAIEREQFDQKLKSTTAKLGLLQSVAASANAITDTDDFIQICIDSICNFAGWPVGHAYMVMDKDTQILRSTKIWHLDDPHRFAPFLRITEQSILGKGIDIPGRVMALGKPKWILDVTKDPGFHRTLHAERCGLKGGFVFPVNVHDKCVMVLEFYSCESEAPDTEFMGVFANVVEHISQRMEREQAGHALRTAKAESEQAVSMALAAAEEATAASQAKSDFLANMSHELRTPLNGMLGFADLIEQESLGPLGDGQYAEFIKIIGQSGRHLLSVINDILDYSKIEAGKLELDPIPFGLWQLADSTVDLLASTANDNGTELACFVAPDVPMKLVGDLARVRQVLLNLTSNAIKFTEEGGIRIDVSLESTHNKDVYLRFEVCDTGIGIAEDAQRKLFEKFVQADESTTRKYGGTGLGLAISKQLVELMDGEIGVNSRAGQGSTFWFTVKLTKQAVSGVGTLGKLVNSMQNEHALMVGGNRVGRAVCRKYLETLGAKVTMVDDSETALTALSQTATEAPYNLIIVDQLVPVEESKKLCRHIRNDAPHSDCKLVLSSLLSSAVSHKDVQEIGFDAALSKPLHRSAIIECFSYLHGIDLPESAIGVADYSASMSSKQRLRILIAEDNEVNRLLLETILGRAGHEVDMAENGQEAVDAVASQAYDLVLMDVHMPIMNGLEATRRIRQMSGAEAKVPIIAVTAAVMREDRENCYQAGMNDCVSKPVNKRDLFEVIANLTGSEITYPVDKSEDESGSKLREPSDEDTVALEGILASFDDVA